jgi:hypothetical protein
VDPDTDQDSPKSPEPDSPKSPDPDLPKIPKHRFLTGKIFATLGDTGTVY